MIASWVTKIPGSGDTSGKVDLSDYLLVAVRTPSSLDGSAFTFEAGVAQGNAAGAAIEWLPVYDDTGTEVSVAVGTDRHVVVDPALFSNFRFVRVVSDSAEGSEREIELVLRGL